LRRKGSDIRLESRGNIDVYSVWGVDFVVWEGILDTIVVDFQFFMQANALLTIPFLMQHGDASNLIMKFMLISISESRPRAYLFFDVCLSVSAFMDRSRNKQINQSAPTPRIFAKKLPSWNIVV
jgi:hypothetical protein